MSTAERLLLGALLLAIPGCGSDAVTSPQDPPAPTPPPPPPPPAPDGLSIGLAVGEAAVLTEPDDLAAFTIEGGAGAREYRVAVQSALPTGTGSTPMQLVGTAAAGAASRVSFSQVRAADPRHLQAAELTPGQRGRLAARRLQEAAHEELLRMGARPARPGIGAVGPGLAARATTVGVPELDDVLQFFIPINASTLAVSCTNTASMVEARVRAVGEQFVVARDNRGDDAFTEADYARIIEVLDDFVYPVNTEYFGQTADLDDNDRVIVLVTEAVNELGDADDDVIFAGFFLGTDISDPASCPASNAAEILYIRAPDPDGEFGQPTSVEEADRTLQVTTAHEFQHLINAEQRFILGSADFAQSEDAWLNEGLSHLAEELVGLAVAGLPLRANLGIEAIAGNVDVANTFLLDNLVNIGASAGCPGWMTDPENFGTIFGDDPPGCATIAMRGWAWLFLRWLGDQEAPAGGSIIAGADETGLFRELVTGGPLHLAGTENVERAVQTIGSGKSWSELMADFLIMPAVDDQADGLPEATQLLTWNLPDVFLGLHENSGTGEIFPNEYPLDIESVPFSDVTSLFAVRTSSAKYFTLVSGEDTPDYDVQLLSQSGAALPSTSVPQVTVVRIR